MAVLLVIGNSRSGQDLSELLDVVEQRSRTQLAETAYAIDTYESPETVCDTLVARFGTEDQVYVLAVTGPYKGRSYSQALTNNRPNDVSQDSVASAERPQRRAPALGRPPERCNASNSA